jgi:hypothetical protein
MMVRDSTIWVRWKDGRGRIVGYVTRRRRIHAVILFKESLIAKPLDELKVARAPRRNK